MLQFRILMVYFHFSSCFTLAGLMNAEFQNTVVNEFFPAVMF